MPEGNSPTANQQGNPTVNTIATTIKNQIGIGSLMTLGAHALREDCNGRALTFKALILPFRKDGSRGTRARKMEVSVLLQEDDTYSVAVYDLTNLNQHYSRDDVYAHELPRLMLALDYDGDEVLNPRYL